jgi:tetratricopeptide (TPR) repeat protein
VNVRGELAGVAAKLRAGAYVEAVVAAERVLAHAPGDIEAMRLLCAALRGSGEAARALALLERLALRAPDDALVHNSLGAALRERGDLERAAAAFARAAELDPALVPAWYNLAVIRYMQDALDDARAAIERAAALAPDSEPVRVLRADLLGGQGHFVRASAEYRALIARDACSPWGWYGLANLKSVAFTRDDLEAMRTALRLHAAPGRERTLLLFAFARACDQHGLHAEALAALAEANAAMAQVRPWDAAALTREVDAALAAFDPPRAGAALAQGGEVIFVVGLPRSGTTLVEQILASHPQVDGAGECDALEQVLGDEDRRRGRAWPAWAVAATAQDWARLGADYLERTARWRARRPRCVDKMPANWRLVGAIAAMLPQARIVVCRRDALETAFSCWRQLFAGDGHGYSYTVDGLGAYWRDFDRACRRWRELHPERVYDMHYEALLDDQEAGTRALLAFCGLAFDPACLRFEGTERSVTTLSAAQVREPLRRDTARTPAYGALLDPLRAALGLPPFAARA